MSSDSQKFRSSTAHRFEQTTRSKNPENKEMERPGLSSTITDDIF